MGRLFLLCHAHIVSSENVLTVVGLSAQIEKREVVEIVVVLFMPSNSLVTEVGLSQS